MLQVRAVALELVTVTLRSAADVRLLQEIEQLLERVYLRCDHWLARGDGECLRWHVRQVCGVAARYLQQTNGWVRPFMVHRAPYLGDRGERSELPGVDRVEVSACLEPRR